MNSRLDRAPAEQLVQEVIRLQDDINDLKSLQRIGGGQVQGYLARSDADYDTTSVIPPNGQVSRSLTFVPPIALYAPMAQLFLYYSLSPQVMSSPIPPYANGPVVSMIVQDYPLFQQTQQWLVTFRNNTSSPQTIYAKIYINTSALGSAQFFQSS